MDDRHGTVNLAYYEEFIGRLDDYERFFEEYGCAALAIGNTELRRDLMGKLKETFYRLVSLVSPRAYISPSAQLDEGCIVELFVAVNANAFIDTNTILSLGAIINHNSIVMSCSHIDCGVVVGSGAIVKSGRKIEAGSVVKRKLI